jgi:hypothetical protein
MRGTYCRPGPVLTTRRVYHHGWLYTCTCVPHPASQPRLTVWVHALEGSDGLILLLLTPGLTPVDTGGLDLQEDSRGSLTSALPPHISTIVCL